MSSSENWWSGKNLLKNSGEKISDVKIVEVFHMVMIDKQLKSFNSNFDQNFSIASIINV